MAYAFQNAFELLKPIILLILQKVVALEFTLNLAASDRVILILQVQHRNLLMNLHHMLSFLGLDHLHEKLINTHHNLHPLPLKDLDVLLDSGWNLTGFSLHSLCLFDCLLAVDKLFLERTKADTLIKVDFVFSVCLAEFHNQAPTAPMSGKAHTVLDGQRPKEEDCNHESNEPEVGRVE